MDSGSEITITQFYFAVQSTHCVLCGLLVHVVEQRSGGLCGLLVRVVGRRRRALDSLLVELDDVLVLVGVGGLLYLGVTAVGEVGEDVRVHVCPQDLVLSGQHGHRLL